jgi:hypothetical protein|tara:strand:- start:509 stop:1477 length:969 start_codon:yes stop_codon:yes gene_type:complete
MPDATGKTTFGRTDYKTQGVNFFSDDHVTGFSPLMQLGQSKINGVFNVNDDGEVQPPTFTAPALGQVNLPPVQSEGLTQKEAYDVGLGVVDFFSNKDRPGFIKNISGLGTYSVFNSSENAATPNDSWSGWNINESSLMLGGFNNGLENGYENSYNIPNQPLEPTENLEDRQSVYNNPGNANEDVFASSALPGQVKSGKPNYDSYNAPPEPMLDFFTQIGSVYSLGGRTDKEIPEPPAPPNFAQMAFQHNRAMTNSRGGGIESVLVSNPKGKTNIAVGIGIEATGGGEQNLQALSEPANVESTLNSALNNINSNYNNNINGIL